MSQHVETAASAAASSPGLRATVGGGIAMLGSGASHWIEWINSGISILLGVAGLVAVIYGVVRQREQRRLELERAEREKEQAVRDREMHEAEMLRIRRATPPEPLGGGAEL